LRQRRQASPSATDSSHDRHTLRLPGARATPRQP
jgi:hypothetical protein